MQTRSWLIILLSITLFAACGKEAKIAQPAGAASAPTNDPSAEVVCSSMQDYESGLKYGMKTAPLCDIVKTDLKKCIGEYSKENWTNCLGERNMPDGSRYLGGYLDGKANGKGEFINKDGTRYIGYYLNGQRHGEGKEYSAAGIIEKTGKWVKGEYDSDVQINQNNTAGEKAAIEQQKLAVNSVNEFPFYAVISCGIGMGHMTIMACFSGDYGSLEVRNGNEYGLYKIVHIANNMIPNASEQQEGLIINLRNNFEIIAQNGDGQNLILGVKIIRRSSNSTVFEKQASTFGVIRVRN